MVVSSMKNNSILTNKPSFLILAIHKPLLPLGHASKVTSRYLR